MKAKIFGDKKITIKEISQKDLKNVKKFQDFINSLIEEDAKILINEKQDFKREKEWLVGKLKNIKKRKDVTLVAEYNNTIIANTNIDLGRWRQNQIGNLGISIIKSYRGIGLGKYLMGEILKLAKKELKPKPKVIRLSVFSNNKPAINLYKKFGFKKVAKIPKQIQYKGKLIDEVIMLLET